MKSHLFQSDLLITPDVERSTVWEEKVEIRVLMCTRKGGRTSETEKGKQRERFHFSSAEEHSVQVSVRSAVMNGVKLALLGSEGAGKSGLCFISSSLHTHKNKHVV